MNATGKQFIAFVLSASLLAGFQARALASGSVTPTQAQQRDQASAALLEGRRLLKRGKGDQALSQLQTALKLYTSSNNKHGIAAAHKELGDLYLRQGQDKTALDHYQKAHQALTGALTSEQREAAASGSAARMVDSRAGTAAKLQPASGTRASMPN